MQMAGKGIHVPSPDYLHEKRVLEMKIHNIELPKELAARLTEFRRAMRAVKKISKVPSMVHPLLSVS
jgi:hypothetical protein